MIGNIVPEKHLLDVCKYRQKEKCCKYVIWSIEHNDFCCVKLNEKAKNKIDQTENMIAKSDNCPGI